MFRTTAPLVRVGTTIIIPKPVKQQLTIRLDADVLAWLKAQGRGYQTRINRILRLAMESQPRRSAG